MEEKATLAHSLGPGPGPSPTYTIYSIHTLLLCLPFIIFYFISSKSSDVVTLSLPLSSLLTTHSLCCALEKENQLVLSIEGTERHVPAQRSSKNPSNSPARSDYKYNSNTQYPTHTQDTASTSYNTPQNPNLSSQTDSFSLLLI